MKLIRDPKKIQQLLREKRAQGKSIGFVPTMGALHEGHLSLVDASNRENAVTVVSLFVNPTQFGPHEDYAKYPRVLDEDSKKLRAKKVDYLFCPSAQAMYPEGYATFVDIRPCLANVLCGKFRPGHFRGVATVVAKLLNLVGPCRAYFGAKDYQQTVVIRRMVRDLNLDVGVRVMPTVREPDGLAMSSRNRYLSAGERARARVISRVLSEMKRTILEERLPIARVKAWGIRALKKAVDRVQYLEVVDPETLEPVKKMQPRLVVLAACFVGKTRLIDNVTIAA